MRDRRCRRLVDELGEQRRDVQRCLADGGSAHGLSTLAAHELGELAREPCLEQPDARAAEPSHASPLHPLGGDSQSSTCRSAVISV
jgi:hypothetical protein